jgi:NTE family protein
VSTPERPVNAHFVHLTFNGLEAPEDRQFINSVPTSFDLSDEQVDRVIAAGRELLREHPEFQRFLAEYTGEPTTD